MIFIYLVLIWLAAILFGEHIFMALLTLAIIKYLLS